MPALENVREVPKAAGGLPVVGHALTLKKDPVTFFLGLRSVGAVVRIRFGPNPAYVVNDEDLIRQIFVSDAHLYDKGAFWDKMRALVGNGLANSSGATHLRQRRMMQPMFHRQRIAWCGAVMAEFWRERVDSWESGQTMSIPAVMTDAALAMVVRTMFASRIGAEAIDSIRTHFQSVQDGLMFRTLNPLPVLEKLPTPGNRRYTRGINAIWSAIDKVIDAYQADGADHGDLLSILVAARDADTGEPMDSAEIRDQVLTIALAGTDTTANALGWSCYQLGRNPVIADKIAAEVAETIGDKPLTFEDLSRLTYTDQFVQEVLRYYAFWMLMRRTLADVTLGGHRIPAGSQVLISPIALHRDPEIFPEAAVFDPDRWSDGGPARRTSYIPFGAGARQCIGDRFAWAETMLGVATICRRWRLRPVAGQVTSEVYRIAVNPSPLRMTVTEP